MPNLNLLGSPVWACIRLKQEYRIRGSLIYRVILKYEIFCWAISHDCSYIHLLGEFWHKIDSNIVCICIILQF